MTRVVVDPDRCVGHGRCYTLAPDVFEPDELGHSIVIASEVTGELADQARTGAENCPERAVSLS